MITPYDWQEGIGNRAQYIEARLAQGSPVIAVSLEEGILVYTRSRGARKIFEVYDRLIMGAIGQQSDVDALRTSAVEFAHREGYSRSEEDVSIQRIVSGLSDPIKRAFADFAMVPFVARTLFAEVNEKQEDDGFYVLDFDGDFRVRRDKAVIAGSEQAVDQTLNALKTLKPKATVKTALPVLSQAWDAAFDDQDEVVEKPAVEAVLLSRSGARENRFITIERSTV
ncbi:MAG: hypothetical protein JSS72_02085 [Armatimonadetes bacterium]|nr:hypothetical protein [Armatimonadota bacterium]